jgi:ParB-like chromosome segregation protein Spo0J
MSRRWLTWRASITSHGVSQPILVRVGADGMFIIVSGERRYQATTKAGLATIPAILTDGEPAEISMTIDLTFVNQFYDKLYTLDDTKLSAEQKVALHLNLEKLRSMTYQKMKVHKG